MKTLKLIVAAVLLLGTTAFTADAGGYKVGDIATDFELENIDGKMVSLSDYKDAKGFIVIFTCNTCPYAVAYEDRIIALDKKYKDKGYPVIAVNPNDPAAQRGEDMNAMKKRSKEKGFTFPYLFDKGQKVYPKYGATKTPHVYLLDKDLVVQYIGAIDDSSRDPEAVNKKYVEEAIEALKRGDKPSTTYTRAIGCSIKTLK